MRADLDRRSLPRCVALALLLAAAVATPAAAISLEPVDAAGAKVSSPGIPGSVAIFQQFTADALGGLPVGNSNVQAFPALYSVVADPGDPPGARLCVAYTLDVALTGTVVASPGSAAAGFGGPINVTVDATTTPASVTVPDPALLLVTPLVGPVQQILSAGPIVLATTTAQTLALARAGVFEVMAGDTISFVFAEALALRGEGPAGRTSGSNDVRFALRECSGAASVPALDWPALATLAALVTLTALALARRRRARR